MELSQNMTGTKEINEEKGTLGFRVGKIRHTLYRIALTLGLIATRCNFFFLFSSHVYLRVSDVAFSKSNI